MARRLVPMLLALVASCCAIPAAVGAQGGKKEKGGGGDRTLVAEKGPQKVDFGIYLNNIQDFDQQDNTFYADFFLWMRWRGHGDGYGNPARSFEITNNIERWGLSQSPVYDAPKVLENGKKLQSFRIQGRFFEPLNLIDYPLDKQTLTINIEDVSAPTDKRVYVPDTAESGTDPKAILPGWQIKGSEVSVDDHLYETDFGETGAKAANRTYSSATFGLSIARPSTFFAWKLLLPLIIVVLLGGSVLLIHPSLIEVRIAAPATALLSMVFLQQGYSDTLPQIGSLVLLDKIYALAYGLIIFLMAAVIYTAYKFRTTGDDVALMALDRKLAVGAISVFAGGSLLLVLLNVA